MSAVFYNDSGDLVCKIDRNELMISGTAHDVIQQGRTFKVMDSDGQIAALMEVQPPHKLHIQRMFITVDGRFMRVNSEGFEFHGNR